MYQLSQMSIKQPVDSYMEDPENYVCKQEWIDELWKVAQRELATGFYYDTPSENEQLFGERRKIPVYKFVGEVLSYDEGDETSDNPSEKPLFCRG